MDGVEFNIRSKSSLTWLRVSIQRLSLHRTPASTTGQQLLQSSTSGQMMEFVSAATSYFFFSLSPTSTPSSRHPNHPLFSNRGPSGWLLIYKCLCVLKCRTKGAGLWPLGVPTLCRFIVRRWERGFGTETPGHWPTHIPEPCHSCAQRCMSPRSSHCFSGNNSLTPLPSLREKAAFKLPSKRSLMQAPADLQCNPLNRD